MTEETMGDEWAAECEKIARRCQNARHTKASAYERDDALSDAAIALRHAALASRPAPSEASADVVEKAFCNKCGFMGPVADATNHKRQDGTTCAYTASIRFVGRTPAPQAEALREAATRARDYLRSGVPAEYSPDEIYIPLDEALTESQTDAD